MKKLLAVLLCLFFVTGCCSADSIYKVKELDGTSSEQVLVLKYNNSYFVNMTDGIFTCSEDFECAEQLTREYCYDPYIEDEKLYYVGNGSFANVDTLKVKDLSTEEVEILYEFDNYQCYRHVGDVWYLCDGNKVIKIREEDGMHLFETSIKDLFSVEFINDDFLLYRMEYDNQSLMLFELKSQTIRKVFTLENGIIGETVMCDGANVFYTLNDNGVKSFCSYNMKSEEHKILLEGSFGEEFNICEDVCYFYRYEEKDSKGYIKAFDMKAENIEILLATNYDVQDINILDNKLFYRKTDYGKQIEVLNLEDNTTVYLYEKYADITQRV